MGKASKALKEFIDGIPANKLTGLPNQAGTISSDKDFRFDMQGMTSDKPPKHNLQVQINNQTGISTLKKLAPKTVSHYNAASDASAATVRKGLIDGMKI